MGDRSSPTDTAPPAWPREALAGQWLLLSFFPSPSLVELKSDRGKSGAGLWPGQLGLPTPGAIPAGGTRAGPARGGGLTPGTGRFVSGQSREGANCRGGAGGEGGRGSRATPDSSGSARHPPLGGGPANPLLERKLIAAAREGRIKASVDPHPPGRESWYLLLN